MSRHFDSIIIGAGQAGPPLAGRLTQAGQTVALIERKLFGGTCVNTGCIPTKTMVASAYAAHMARRASDFGVRIQGSIQVDMKEVKARKKAILAKSRDGIEKWLRGMEKCTVFHAPARFVSSHEIQVDSEIIGADRIFINVGGRAVVPDMRGVNEIPYLTNSTILELDELPEHLVVVGGSYVGLEFAQMFRRFGSKVTIVEKSSRLIMHEDEDISAAVKEILESEGIDLRLDAECIAFEPAEQGAFVHTHCDAGDPKVHASHVLLAVGRRPNTDDLGLEKAGVQTDERGYILVDDELRTNVPGIWAMGDCNGKSPESRPQASERPDSGACALYRSAAGPDWNDGSGSEEDREARVDRHPSHDQGRKSGGEGRKQGLYEGAC